MSQPINVFISYSHDSDAHRLYRNLLSPLLGHEEPNKGKGVDWEGALITQELYDSRSQTLKFVPVFLNDALPEHIPDPLCSISHYALTYEKNYQNLYDFLLGQAGVVPHPVGIHKTKPPIQGRGCCLSLSFPARGAGQSSYLPRDLLTRAWLRMAELRRVDTMFCPRGEQTLAENVSSE